ncbi:BMP family ABC transporter substrate-binding protein [Agrococcus versicolor]|uniref:BMP family ABC transporter substrate-binding protein n=1 Tax=Agrococcus versicolor TaxID=501482 RepID=A0ABP5MAN6_9MICO
MRNIRKTALGGLATLGVAALLAGCASAPEEGPAESGEATADISPCIVSDSGGFNDQSFNQLGLEGLEAAAEELGVESNQAESQAETDYQSNIANLIDNGCDMMITVGFLLAEATSAAAESNPDVNFAIIDDNSITADNVQPITFDTAQAAFLAGYAAAASSQTGVIATWGGINIPPVTIFMDGFVLGAEYYNSENGADVQVLGWDVEAQDGTFVGAFEAGPAANATATTFLQQNADIVMPVGGPIFLSAGEAIRTAQSENPDVRYGMIGVDADLSQTAPEYADLFVTSVLKGMDAGVEAVVLADAAGEFSSDPYVGTLENDGVGIAGFNEWEDQVPEGLADELETIRTAIIAGDIEVDSPSSP